MVRYETIRNLIPGPGAIYLATYMMEAVGFAEFMYEEACQQGLAVLQQIKRKHQTQHLNYMGRKFLNNILLPAYNFHLDKGNLNPFTYPAFDAYYSKAWKTYDTILYTP